MTFYRVFNKSTGADLGGFHAENPGQVERWVIAQRKMSPEQANALEIFNETEARRDILEMLDDVNVEHDGEYMTDYDQLLLTLSQYFEGSLPPGEYEFDWSAYPRERAKHTIEKYAWYVGLIYESLCANTELDFDDPEPTMENCVGLYELSEDGNYYQTVEASSFKAALRIAEANVDRGNYPVDEDPENPCGTIWLTAMARHVFTRECETARVSCDPEEPDCRDDKPHRWRTPYELLGGDKQNPGVWGHGGGLRFHAVCMRCGTERVRDTWAQDPESGEQGLESIIYYVGKFANELEKSHG